MHQTSLLFFLSFFFLVCRWRVQTNLLEHKTLPSFWICLLQAQTIFINEANSAYPICFIAYQRHSLCKWFIWIIFSSSVQLWPFWTHSQMLPHILTCALWQSETLTQFSISTKGFCWNCLVSFVGPVCSITVFWKQHKGLLSF